MPEIQPLPELSADTRPRWQRIAHQNFLQGYRLHIERPRRFAEWRKRGSDPRGIPFEMALRIAGSMGREFGEMIIRVGIGSLSAVPLNEPLAQPTNTRPMTEETTKLVLTKSYYTAAEIGDLIGMGSTWVHGYRARLTAEKSGDDYNAPWHYFADEKLVSLLEDRGYDVEVEIGDDQVDVAGDGQAGPEPEPANEPEGLYPVHPDVDWEVWTPTPENVELLPDNVRMYVKALETAVEVAQSVHDNLEGHIERMCEGRVMVTGDPAVVNEVAMNGVTALAQAQDHAEEEREEARKLVGQLREVHQKERERHAQVRDELSKAYNSLATTIVRAFEKHCPTTTYVDAAQALDVLLDQVDHAYQKGRADEALERDRNGDTFDVRRILEAAKIHQVDLAEDNVTLAIGGEMAARIRAAEQQLVIALISRDEEAIDAARTWFRGVCAQTIADSRHAIRAARRARLAMGCYQLFA